MILMMAILLAVIMVVSPVAAWGASVKVAAVDDESGTSATSVYSGQMGTFYYSDYAAQTITTEQPANINAATLAKYDTLFLFACNPAVFSASQKADIVAWVNAGGKLVITDSEDPYPNTWDYTWLPAPFATAVPGAQGASGKLFDVEENQISKIDTTSPFYIDNLTLSSGTDAVGDANIFTSYVPSDWCVDMIADNVLAIPPGPTVVYTKGAGDGIVIYDGLDWDYAGSGTGYSGNGQWIKKIIRNAFNAYSLPCSQPPIQQSLIVDKTCDKTVYAKDDLVVCTITVTNPGTYTAQNVGLVDYPPAEITMGTTTASLGNIAPGQTITTVFRATADKEGCDLENKVVATGYYGGQPIFTGGDTFVFTIGDPAACNPHPSPEFPTLALPVGMILGLAFVVYSLKPVRKN
jgi:uncharacterized repeat protein (TIGR01451 family)